ncbi:NADPH-dependent 7-cyano-7-deazaguanine reductase QueF [Porticoccaceae bacterium]|nr:NADPH-dependent 7-cyano-7-deazaguanine reductase QueF [Porticoccaceae bacterium]MDC0002757.1 NADPH-dependent 7-cyano-7-deazaguanine reductase QueF [Porticoccaceae bacterium]
MVDHSDTGLGKDTTYADQYDAGLLFPIPRSKARAAEYHSGNLPFFGTDLWTAFEISWLNEQGVPQAAIGEFSFPCTSDAIIESKSFKLYLNSFNQSQYANAEAVKSLMQADLSAACGAPVDMRLYEVGAYNAVRPVAESQGICIDQRPVTIDTYQPDASFLQADKRQPVTETLYSHLLRTNCPVTDQPDWASLYISYTGGRIDADGLLKYIVSFRQHQDFHEQCVEKIFSDIMQRCEPTELSVYARYMRRGGLDINPYRSTKQSSPPNYRQVRQ